MVLFLLNTYGAYLEVSMILFEFLDLKKKYFL